MKRLVVVSNRVSLPDQHQAGGLAVALGQALSEIGGVWFGWSGKTTATTPTNLHETESGNIRYLTLDLSRADHDSYYHGFANRTLWPLLHFRPDLVDYTRETYAGYLRVNEIFADRLAAHLRDDDRVWIHDYHLIPLGKLLRERGVKARLGFFLHVPMPSADLVAALPGHFRLFPTLAAYDLVGFQTKRDVERFQDYVRLFGGGRVLDYGLLEDSGGRRFRAGSFPVSIDTGEIASLAASAVRKGAAHRLRDSLSGRILAIGVDRLDYSKGLPERFRAINRYFERHADRGKLTYLQIAPISRGDVPEYQALRHELEQLAGHINGGHALADWTPVRYVNRNFPHSTLAGYYRIARLALVTPLRDGMNLVAKEYVASQDPEDPGVLVLSSFAGAARELDAALLVNPFDLDGVADAIAEAATMSLEERRQRWRAMMDKLEQYDITTWRRDYLAALGA